MFAGAPSNLSPAPDVHGRAHNGITVLRDVRQRRRATDERTLSAADTRAPGSAEPGVGRLRWSSGTTTLPQTRLLVSLNYSHNRIYSCALLRQEQRSVLKPKVEARPPTVFGHDPRLGTRPSSGACCIAASRNISRAPSGAHRHTPVTIPGRPAPGGRPRRTWRRRTRWRPAGATHPRSGCSEARSARRTPGLLPRRRSSSRRALHRPPRSAVLPDCRPLLAIITGRRRCPGAPTTNTGWTFPRRRGAGLPDDVRSSTRR